MLFPFGIADTLGVPVPDLNSYPTILGAVIFGVVIALLLEIYGEPRRIRGLGLGGYSHQFLWRVCTPWLAGL
jgi:hypothetical protein